MIYPMYSIRDALVGFQSPTLMNNDAFAMRAFEEGFKSVHNPSDYSMWKVAEFDTETGEILPIIPVVICNATDFLKGDKVDE